MRVRQKLRRFCAAAFAFDCAVPLVWASAQASTAANARKTATTAALIIIASGGIVSSHIRWKENIADRRPQRFDPDQTGWRNYPALLRTGWLKPRPLPHAAASASARAESSRQMPPGTIAITPARSSLVNVRLTVSIVSPR